jgi:hypothetical protein
VNPTQEILAALFADFALLSPEMLDPGDPVVVEGADVGALVAHALHTGQASVLLNDLLDPHGHEAHVGEGVCCTGGSVGAAEDGADVVGDLVVHALHTGQASVLLNARFDPQGHGAHVEGALVEGLAVLDAVGAGEEQGKHTGQASVLLNDLLDPHGHGAHVEGALVEGLAVLDEQREAAFNDSPNATLLVTSHLAS